MYTNEEFCYVKNLLVKLVERSIRHHTHSNTLFILIIFPFPLYKYSVVVEFQPNSYTINEEDGVVAFIIVKQSQTTEAVEVQFHTQDGSATCKLQM